jgi:hypothetical protein|tara:strand:+ start:2498 stop:2731 length:234 start_codon:yes stop_codon:yes gene_type:complete
MGYEFINDSRLTILAYDLSIKDIKTRRASVVEFKTLKIAQQKLLIGQNIIKNAIVKKTRVYSEALGKEYALRIKPLK